MDGQVVKVHSLAVRITHWVNVSAILIMALSGWRIYNAAPLFAFSFPSGLTLGGWLAGALQWHFAGMWLLTINGVCYIAYGICSGHFRRKLFPVSPATVMQDVKAVLCGRTTHADLRIYNAAQRAAYIAAIVLGIVLVVSGLVMWKPVQLHALGVFIGDYEGARYVHFLSMAVLFVFIIIHVAMVLLVPRTFTAMLTGHVRLSAAADGTPK
jgi:thiosulfate reductase cytochrome b subunit